MDSQLDSKSKSVMSENESLSLDDVLEKKTISILRDYNGKNDYILKLKKRMLQNPRFFPTKAQCAYIMEFKDSNPLIGKKWVKIDYYFSKKISDSRLYPEVPELFYVYKILGERSDSFHVWGRFKDEEPYDDFWFPKGALRTEKENRLDIDYSKYKNKPPKEYQKIAINKLLNNDTFILADDMGLGKTYSSLIAALEGNHKKILIVCPASLKYNWKSEIEEICNKKVGIVNGNTWEDGEFIIINYEILKNFHSESESKILESNFDLIIIDEAHYLSNPKSDRSKIVTDFTKKIKKIWLLTGTPVTSKPANYINLLKLIRSPLVNNWSAFVQRYCNGYQFTIKGKGRSKPRKIWKINGSSNLDELSIRLKDFVLRRLKTKELDLPDKIIIPKILKLESSDYKREMGEYIEWQKSQKDMNINLSLQKIVKVRQILANEKLPLTIEIAENAIESGKKVLIFTSFTEPVNKLMEYFKERAVRFDGKMSNKEREVAKEKFKTDENTKVFIGNIIAAGVGHTLTEAEVVIMNDLSFVPSQHSQAEDRAYRIGQTNDVLVYYPLFGNSFEMKIYEVLRRKMRIISAINGEKDENNEKTLEEIVAIVNEG